MMRTRDMMMMSGDNLRGNSPFRCDLFEFERYFDMSPCISIFFASIFSSSSSLFLSAKERERDDRRVAHPRIAFVGRRSRTRLVCVSSRGSIIHRRRPNFDYLVPPAGPRNN